MKRKVKADAGEKMTPLRLATVFSGIGAIEQALLRMYIDFEVVSASDNGDSTYGK